MGIFFWPLVLLSLIVSIGGSWVVSVFTTIILQWMHFFEPDELIHIQNVEQLIVILAVIICIITSIISLLALNEVQKNLTSIRRELLRLEQRKD